MKKPNIKLSSGNLYTWGIEVCEGLAFFPESAALGASFITAVEGMKKFAEERQPLELALIPLRSKVRFADYTWDSTLRTFAKNVEIKDGGKRGALYAAIFPDGITALTRASGASQIAPAEAFIARLSASKATPIEALRAEWLPKLQAALDALKSAVEGRAQMQARISDLLVRERAAKEEFDISVEKLMGEVRAIFPKDSSRWDVIFPSGNSPSSPTAEPDQPAATATTA